MIHKTAQPIPKILRGLAFMSVTVGMVLGLMACTPSTPNASAAKNSGINAINTTTLDTQQAVSFAQLQAQGKVVIVNFWATTCSTCKREMPKMKEIFERYQAKGVSYVSVAMQYDDPEVVKNYARVNQLPFLLVWDQDGSVARAFGGIEATPTTYIINKKGQTKKYVGEPDWAQFTKDIDSALQ